MCLLVLRRLHFLLSVCSAPMTEINTKYSNEYYIREVHSYYFWVTR